MEKRSNIVFIKVIEKYFTIFFYGFSIFILSLIVQGLILTLANIFFLRFVLLSGFISLIISLILLRKIIKDIRVLPTISFSMILLAFAILGILVFFPHDSFGGADQSVYSNMAVHLARSGTLNLPAYLNNLPNNYAEDSRSRLPVYTVWLAIQYIFFGNEWLLRSNVVLIGLALFSLFIVSSLISGKKNSLVALILFSTCMPFLWFSRETLSEVLSLYLLWTLVLFFIMYIKTNRYIFFLVTLSAVGLFALCRLEGFFIQASIMLAHFITLFISKIRSIKKIVLTFCIYLILISSNIFIIKFFSFSSYFQSTVKIASVGLNTSITSLIAETDSSSIKTTADEEKLSKKIPLFIYNMLAKYNYILVLVSIFLITILTIIKKTDYLKLNKKYFFIVLIILLPEFYKFINPGVSLFQPWLYRRFIYALLPFGYISLAILYRDLANNKKHISLVIMFLLIVINLSLSYNVVFLKNNWLLIDKLKQITNDISQKDLVIIADSPLGSYSSTSYLVLNKGVRSTPSSILWQQDFIPEKKTFNGVPYNKIFLLSKNAEQKQKPFQIKNKIELDIQYNQLKSSCVLYLLGEDLQLRDIYSWSSIPYADAIKYCNRPEYEILRHKERLFLYELL